MSPVARLAGQGIFVGLLVLTQLSCGKSKNADVSITIMPDRPVVIDTDFKHVGPSGDELTAEAPWFRFMIKVSNNSTSPVTIVTFKGTVFAFGPNGAQEGTIELDDMDNVIAVVEPGVQDFEPNILFYSDSLPDVGTHNYSVNLTFSGWFGQLYEPEKRFEKQLSFTTQ